MEGTGPECGTWSERVYIRKPSSRTLSVYTGYMLVVEVAGCEKLLGGREEPGGHAFSQCLLISPSFSVW